MSKMPGFAAEASLYRTAGIYVLESTRTGKSVSRVVLQQIKGCTPCENGQKTCCFGYDPETGGPICKEVSCTPPPPPPPRPNCGTHSCPPGHPCCARGCCPPGTSCCNNEGCCPAGTKCRRICVPFIGCSPSFCTLI